MVQGRATQEAVTATPHGLSLKLSATAIHTCLSMHHCQCNALLANAMHNLSVQSNSMQHLSVKAMQCSTCQCNCNAIQCNPIHCNTKLHCTPLPCTALLYVAQSCFLPDLTRSSNLIRSPNFTRSPNLMLSRTLDGRFWDRGEPFLSFSFHNLLTLINIWSV